MRRYRPGLVAFAAAYAPSDRAEDVVQESLIRSWDALRDSKGEMKLKAWLYTIVRNRALNARARRAHPPTALGPDRRRAPARRGRADEGGARPGRGRDAGATGAAAGGAGTQRARGPHARADRRCRRDEPRRGQTADLPRPSGRPRRRRAAHPTAARTHPRRARRDGRARGRGGGSGRRGRRRGGRVTGDQGRRGHRSRRDRRRLGNRDRALGELRTRLRERAGHGRYARTRRRRSSARRRLRGLLGSGAGIVRVVGTRLGPR